MTFFLLSVFGGLNTLQAHAASEDKALAQKISPLICAQDADLQPLELLAKGVYEAQIAGRLYRKINNKVIDDGFVVTQVKRDAQNLSHPSYAWGRCANGDAWSITAPAPMLAVKVDTAAVTFDYRPVGAYCKNLSVQYAAHNGMSADLNDKLTVNKDLQAKVPLLGLAPGTLSLSCTQFSDATRGTELWYLIPVGPLSAKPPVIIDDKAKSPRDALVTWVNRLREMSKMPSLLSNNDTANAAAIKLTESQILAHNRTQLRAIAAELQTAKLQLIGEDRVVATNIGAMAWLLWNSPGHRTLLLDKKADQLAVHVTQVGRDELLAVFVLTKTVR